MGVGTARHTWRFLPLNPFFLGIWTIAIASFVCLFFTTDEGQCTRLAEGGYWAGNKDDRLGLWQPDGCTTAVYNASDIEECFGDKGILLAGESTVRQVFWAISEKLNLKINRYAKHEEIQNAEGSSVKLQFIWDVYLENRHLHDVMEQKKMGNESDVALLMVGAGLHFAAWRNNSMNEFTDAMKNLYEQETPVMPDSDMAVYVMPTLPSDYNHLKIKVKAITPAIVDEMNDWVLNEMQRSTVPSFKKHYLWSYNEMVTTSNNTAYDFTAIHVTESVAHQKADILLNHYCNPILARRGKLPKNATCCVPSGSRNIGQWIMVAFCLFSVFATVANLLLIEYTDEEEHKFMSRKTSLALLYFCSALLFCFLADRTQAFGKLTKQHDPSQFIHLCSAVLGFILFHSLGSYLLKSKHKSSPTLKPRGLNAILSYGQTEEWKGWMQAAILLYHWTGTSKILWVYRIVRLLVAAYLFMSGYGTTLAILKTKDNLLIKMFRQLLRLNLLSLGLSYIMGSPYLDYYFAPLVSMWLIVIYSCIGLFRTWNNSVTFILLKVVVSCSLTTFVLFKDGIVETIFYFLQTSCNITLDAKEWRFRAGLDPFIVYVGILTAILVLKFRRREEDEELGTTDEYGPTQNSSSGSLHAFAAQSEVRPLMTSMVSVLIAISMMGAWAMLASRKETKASYNALHPYVSPLPILAYVLLRNCHPFIQSRHSELFARLGRCSLETFTLQFHLLLANDTAATLSLNFLNHLPRLGIVRMVELFFIALAFLFTSEKVAQATGALVSLLSRNKEDDTNRSQYQLVAQGDSPSSSMKPLSGDEKEYSVEPSHGKLLSMWQRIASGLWNNYWSRAVGILVILFVCNWTGYDAASQGPH